MTNNMFFIANWKMFGELKSVNSVLKVIKFLRILKSNKVKIIYCPPYTLIERFIKMTKKSQIKIGAQNCHHLQNFGPHTGSISPNLLKSIGVNFVIIGHSENRTSGENNHLINLKIKSALKKKLKVIFCIGETLNEKKTNKTTSVLKKQILSALKNIKKNNNIIFAYEPVWSIGTGLIPNNAELEKQIFIIKKIIQKYWKLKNPNIVYGGSVNNKNVKELKKIQSINGFLVGGSSQNANNFIDIIKKTIN